MEDFPEQSELEQHLEQARRHQEQAAKAERHWQKLCHRLLNCELGRDLMDAAKLRFNHAGSVFDGEFNTHAAAHRDGSRLVISEIENAAAMFNATNETDED